MWLIIRDNDSAVVGTNYNLAPDVPDGFTAREWLGPEPLIHDPENGVESYDPTLDNPAWTDQQARRVDFDALANQAASEIEWLDGVIEQVPSMTTLVALRAVLLRLARQNRAIIKALRFLFLKQ